jgi:hypothetical protein
MDDLALQARVVVRPKLRILPLSVRVRLQDVQAAPPERGLVYSHSNLPCPLDRTNPREVSAGRVPGARRAAEAAHLVPLY